MPASLDTWLEKITALHPEEIDLGLSRLQQVMPRLGLEQFDCPVITISGTNGKGTCAKALEAIYTQDYRVGCYTSPHINRFSERITISGQPIGDDALCRAFEQVDQARGDFVLTFFEFTTLAALYYFQQLGCDVVVLEVGLGGRLDAVNIIDPDVAVITNVALDHQAWLGDNVEAIATEKAGILRQGCPLVFADAAELPITLCLAAEKLACPVYQLGKEFQLPTVDLMQPLSPQSVAAALQVAVLLQAQLPVKVKTLNAALANLRLPGRCQVIAEPHLTWLDVAHNPAACERLARLLRENPVEGKNIAVFSMMSDKSIVESLQAVTSEIDTWYITELGVARSANCSELSQVLLGIAPNQQLICQPDAAQAYADAVTQAGPKDRIIVFGSFYIVAVVLAAN